MRSYSLIAAPDQPVLIEAWLIVIDWQSAYPLFSAGYCVPRGVFKPPPANFRHFLTRPTSRTRRSVFARRNVFARGLSLESHFAV